MALTESSSFFSQKDHVAASGSQAGFDRGRRSLATLILDESQLWIACDQRLRGVGRVVARAVVDDQHLKVGSQLRHDVEQRQDRLFEMRLGVEDRQQDAKRATQSTSFQHSAEAKLFLGRLFVRPAATEVATIRSTQLPGEFAHTHEFATAGGRLEIRHFRSICARSQGIDR